MIALGQALPVRPDEPSIRGNGGAGGVSDFFGAAVEAVICELDKERARIIAGFDQAVAIIIDEVELSCNAERSGIW